MMTTLYIVALKPNKHSPLKEEKQNKVFIYGNNRNEKN